VLKDSLLSPGWATLLQVGQRGARLLPGRRPAVSPSRFRHWPFKAAVPRVDSRSDLGCPITRHVAYAYSTERLIEPCLPTKADRLPSGGLWIHEIKHDGFRIVARKNGAQVKLYSRPGNDLTGRFPLIVETLTNLPTRSCIIDGEAVACDDNGLAVFERIRYRRHDGKVFLYAFDLIELNGEDLRREPLDVRKATLRSLLVKNGIK
jgi:hypothetical protein